MKYTKIYPVIAAALLGLGSVNCTSLLDLTPPMNETEANFYKTQEDMYQSLTAAYGVLNWSAPGTASGSPQNCAFEVVSEIMGDCCYAGGANANDAVQTSRVDRFSMLTSDLYPEALWHKYYSGIFRCNKFFEKVDGATFRNEDLRPMYTAECRFLRAYFYFDLVRLFGNVPLITRTLKPSESTQTQATPAQVYEQIASDLLAAIGALKSDGSPAMKEANNQFDADQKGRITRDAAKALLCRVWLYYTGYYNQSQLPGATAAEMISLIEEVADSGNYSFVANAYGKDPATGSSPLWAVANKNGSEDIFAIQYSALSKWGDWGNREGCLGNQAVILWGLRDAGSPYAAGWSFATVDKHLFDAYDAADPRRWATLINANAKEGTNDGEGLKYTPGFQNTGFFCRKFAPLAANNSSAGSRELNYPNNYPAIRWADALLMAAEMEFRYGSPAKAFEYYAKVHERALGAGSAGAAGSLTLQMILDERLYELALEGHRYWDILRQGDAYAESVLTNGQQGDFAVTYNKTRRGLMPIPQYEITLSRNLLVQNPGY